MVLFAKKWRSAINVESMRLFDTEKQALDYAVALCRDDRDPMLESNWMHAWDVKKGDSGEAPTRIAKFKKNIQAALSL